MRNEITFTNLTITISSPRRQVPKQKNSETTCPMHIPDGKRQTRGRGDTETRRRGEKMEAGTRRKDGRGERVFSPSARQAFRRPGCLTERKAHIKNTNLKPPVPSSASFVVTRQGRSVPFRLAVRFSESSHICGLPIEGLQTSL